MRPGQRKDRREILDVQFLDEAEIVERMVRAYGEEELDAHNCHRTSWMFYNEFHGKMEFQVVLGVVPGWHFTESGPRGPYPITHSWIETDDFIIDTNPVQVAMWGEDYWEDSGSRRPGLNFRVIERSPRIEASYYHDVDEALKACPPSMSVGRGPWFGYWPEATILLAMFGHHLGVEQHELRQWIHSGRIVLDRNHLGGSMSEMLEI